MEKNTSVILGRHYDEFVAQLVREGQYGSVGETILAALRLLEEREGRLKALRDALEEGEESGTADYCLEDLLLELDEEAS